MWWLWFAVPLAQGATGRQAKLLASRMVADVGPRAPGTAGGLEAQDWVAKELSLRGWTPKRTEHNGWATTYSCRRGHTGRVVLFLAHTDSVHSDVPGANDNAAGVAVLLTAISDRLPDVPRRTVCVAFPDGEELGLLGSRGFANQVMGRQILGGPIDQVMAMDLVGAGTLTHNGLGTAWDGPRLKELLRVAPADVPWMYRGISWAFPHMERSDHGPFGAKGIPSSQLMGRGPSGVTWSYHTAADTPDRLDTHTLGAAVHLVRHVARAPPLPYQGRIDAAVVIPGGWVVGGVWLAVAQVLASVGGVLSIPFMDRSVVRGLGQAVLAPLVFGLCATVAAAGRPMDAALTAPVWAAGALGWLTTLLMWPWPSSAKSGRALATTTVVMSLGIGWAAGPILAAPLAVSALGAMAVGGRRRWLVPGLCLAAWPFAFLVRPAVFRELAFHNLVHASPWTWAAIVALVGIAPIAAVQGRILPRSRRAVTPLAFFTALTIVYAWTQPAFDADFPMRTMLSAARP